MHQRPRSSPLTRALGLVALALPFLGAAYLDVPLCPMAALFGVPCPGCGLTRATLAALHGDFALALRFHPLVFWVTPIYGYLLLVLIWDFVRGAPPETKRAPPRLARSRVTNILGGATIALLLGLWIARFLGFFGGPVPVESFRKWHEKQHSPAGSVRSG